MSKRRHMRIKRSEWKETQVAADTLVSALQGHATYLAALHHHSLANWQPSKRKWGKGARINWCVRCTDEVLVLPYGMAKGLTKVEKTSPTILGDAVRLDCEAQERG